MAYGQGTLRETPSGKWKARYWGPDGRQHSKTFDRKTDARDFLAGVQADKRRGGWLDPRKAEQPYGRWALEWIQGQHKLGTVTRARDESLLKNHVLPAFGRTPIGKITPLAVRGWIADLVKKGLSPRTISSCHQILSRSLRAAVAAKLIAEAPIGRGVVDLPKIERKRERFLTEAEVDSLISHLHSRYHLLVLTAAYTGCRWQELAGLTRTNVDLARARLHVRTVTERVGGTVRLKEYPKTDAGRRTIGLPTLIGERLSVHLGNHDYDLVFTGRDGGILREANFRQRHWVPAVKAAGLEPLTFHDLRHTHAAWLVQAGAQALVIQRRLGHKDISTTMNIYGHLFPNAEDSILADLEQRLVRATHRAEVLPLRPAEDVGDA